MAWNSGITLLEVLVTLTILTLVTYLVTTAFPVIREEEALVHARQELASSLRAAQTQALDEQRSPECLLQVGDNPAEAKLCSDVGVMLAGDTLTTFADTNDNDQFDDRDFVLDRSALPQPVRVATPVSLLMEATPPNVILYVDGLPLGAGQQAVVTLQSRQRSQTLIITAYGVLERKTP